MRPFERTDHERLARQVIARASFFHERLGTEYLPEATPRELLDQRLGRWVESVGSGNRTRLERRLTWDGVSFGHARERLGHVLLAPEAAIPPWGRFLAQVLETYRDLGAIDRQPWSFLRREDPVPFEEVLGPIVDLATAELTRTAERTLDLLSPEAFQALQFDLLKSLAMYASTTLNVELSIFKSTRRLTHGMSGITWDKSGTECYDAFIRKLHGAPMVALIEEYPVLGRWLASLSADWIDATRRFLSRLQSDWELLEEAFGRPEPLGVVQSLRPGLSDPHEGRQSVMQLTFSNEASLVYKPKDLGLEAALAAFIAWCQARRPGFPLTSHRMIVRDGYGWCEWLEAAPPATPHEATRYYEACGTLLSVVYALNGSDCHHENLVPQVTHPVLVDAETLLIPFWGAPNVRLEGHSLQAWLNQTNVLNTAMLHTRHAAADGTSVDISGIGAGLSVRTSGRRRRWLHINTDSMVFDWVDDLPDGEASASYPGWAHRDAVVRGFADGYRLLLSHQNLLLAADGPLQAFGNRAARFVPRHTYLYDTLLQRFRHPTLLTDGIEISMALETLCRPFVGLADKPKEWALTAWEHRALARLDVPRFEIKTTSRAFAPGGSAEIPEFLGESGWQFLRLRIASLSEGDLAYQASIIRQSLQGPAGAGTVARRPLEVQSPSQDFLAMAHRIGRRIVEAAVPCPNGGTTWLTMANHDEIRASELARMSSGLFSGAGGTALFLSALARLGLGDGFAEVAGRALRPMQRAIASRTEFEGSLTPSGFGLSEGWASWCYTLVTVGRLLERPELFQWAERAASHLTPEHIANDRRFDLLVGSAGALLALLRLYEATPSEGLLRQAVACAEHLLAHRVAATSGHLVWETVAGSRPLTGFSHGAAGIGYALACLYGATRNPRYREAARQAFAYERSLFDPQCDNWPDFRARAQTEHPVYACSWCNGAPGIVLSRLGAMGWMEDEPMEQEVAAGLRATAAGSAKNLTVCCGLFGQIETLWCAGLRANREDWQAMAISRATRGLADVDAMLETARLTLPAPFFQGMAGIGYQLLRLAKPGELPSILLFEASSDWRKGHVPEV